MTPKENKLVAKYLANNAVTVCPATHSTALTRTVAGIKRNAKGVTIAGSKL